MSNYRISGNGVVRLSDNACIPEDTRNKDWIVYLNWVAAGNLPLPAIAPILSADQVDANTAKADSAVVALRQMTPAQARTWVQNNVNSLADAKSLLSTMAAVLCVLARRL